MGLILIIVGITGSLLVFQKEFDHFVIERQFGQIIQQPQRVAIDSVVDKVKTAYSDRPDLKLKCLSTLIQGIF